MVEVSSFLPILALWASLLFLEMLFLFLRLFWFALKVSRFFYVNFMFVHPVSCLVSAFIIGIVCFSLCNEASCQCFR
jgi:hypothetical protein